MPKVTQSREKVNLNAQASVFKWDFIFVIFSKYIYFKRNSENVMFADGC